MNEGWKRLTIVFAVIWAVGCGIFSFTEAQHSEYIFRKSIKYKGSFLSGIARLDLPREQGRVEIEVPLTKEAAEAARKKELREKVNKLYFIEFPLMWAGLTLGGYFVVATIFFTTR